MSATRPMGSGFTQRSSAHLHHRLTSSRGAKRRETGWRGTVEATTLLAERACSAPKRQHPALGEVCDLFTTAERKAAQIEVTLGNGRNLKRCATFRLRSTCSTIELRFHLRDSGGIRTRNTVVNSEVSDLFTTNATLVLAGNGRDADSPLRGQRALRRSASISPLRSMRSLHHRQIWLPIRGTGET